MPEPNLRDIPAEILARLPASIAEQYRVVPFAVEQGRLLVAYGVERSQSVAKLRKRLRPSIAGPFELCAVRAAEISEAFERYYRIAWVEGCEREWSLCPRRWQALVPTELADLRYCTHCTELVRYCPSERDRARYDEKRFAVATPTWRRPWYR